MKIAYVYISIVPLAGVDLKPIQQALAIKKNKTDNFDILVFNPEKHIYENGVYYIKYKTFLNFPYIDYLLKHNFYRFSVLKNANLEQYDVIILRYPKADKSGIKFYKENNVISEHHGDEYTELRFEGKNSKFILFKLFKYLRAFLEKHYGPKVLNYAKGIIAMNSEIAQIQLARINNNIPAISVPNGISVSETPFSKFKTFSGDKLDIIFPAGHNLFFHGIDRLVKSAENYKGSVKIKIHLLGDFIGSKIIKSPFIEYHGILAGDEYNNILSQMHLGVSTLALFRKETNNSSSLKTRDFTARGLPFIMAYQDTDFTSQPPKNKFFLSFPNNESLLDFEEIINFAKEVSAKKEEISSYMREYAHTYLDWTIKMKQYENFAKKILIS